MSESAQLPRDFRLLYLAHACSHFGVAFSNGAVAYIAVTLLEGTALAVAMIFGVARLVAAIVSIPVGVLVEGRKKRPVLVGADYARSISTLLIPLALISGRLSLLILCILISLDMFFTIVSAAASGAHLRDLVDQDNLGDAFAKLETVSWSFTAIFTPLGGLIVALFGPAVTLSIDAISYAVSALIILRIRKEESTPTSVDTGSLRSYASEAIGGWSHIWANGILRHLFLNAMIFGGSLVLLTPIVAVFVLRDLELEAWHYSTVLGLPALGGVLGARLSRRAERRLGTHRAILLLGTARTLWTIWIFASPVGVAGFLVVLLVESLLMFFAGLFNPIFSAFQISITSSNFLARTSAAWRASAMIVQPVFMILGGIMSRFLGVRTTIVLAGLLLILSSRLLPWSILKPTTATSKTGLEPEGS